MYSEQTQSILTYLEDNNIKPIKVIDKDKESDIFYGLIEFYLAKNENFLLELVITKGSFRLIKIATTGYSHTYFITEVLDLSHIILIQNIIQIAF